MIEPPPPAGKKESHKASQRAAPSRKKRAKCLLVSAAATTATPSGASLRMRTLKSGLDSIMDCTEFKVGCTAGGLLCTHQADDGNDYGDPYYGLYCPRSQDLLLFEMLTGHLKQQRWFVMFKGALGHPCQKLILIVGL